MTAAIASKLDLLVSMCLARYQDTVLGNLQGQYLQLSAMAVLCCMSGS